MRVMFVISLVALLIPASCLVRQTSEEKRLGRVEGNNLTDEQIRANNERAKKNAKTIIKNACGSVLHKSVWVETSDLGDGFFMYQTKDAKLITITGQKTSCPKQYVSIDLQAALYMVEHNVSCSVERGLLRFNLPSQGEADAIKVDCATRLVDLTSANDELRIGTFEEDGSIYTAQLSAQGGITSTNNFAGVSAEKLAELKQKLGDKNLIARLKDKEAVVGVASGGVVITGVAAMALTLEAQKTAIAAKMAGTVVTGKVAVLAGIGSTAAYVAIPVGIAVLLAAKVWSDYEKHKKYKETVLVLREMLRQSLAG